MSRDHAHIFAAVSGDQGAVLTVKAKAQALIDTIFEAYEKLDKLDGAHERCRATAKTNIETGVMWALRGLREGDPLV